MKALAILSICMIPAILFFLVAYGWQQKVDLMGAFQKGAKEGLLTAVSILPTLIGLLAAVGILRSSGLLDAVSNVLGKWVGGVIPVEVIPVAVVRLFSASAATGLLLDLFKKFGADSYVGLTAALLLSSTETLFYCLSVYFGHVQIRKIKYTLAGSLLATMAGMAASVIIAGYMRG